MNQNQVELDTKEANARKNDQLTDRSTTSGRNRWQPRFDHLEQQKGCIFASFRSQLFQQERHGSHNVAFIWSDDYELRIF